MARRPHYCEADSLHLLYGGDGALYLKLSDQHILAWLRAVCANGRVYGKFLAQYPSVMCEPLDLLYVCRRASSTLGVELLQDLLFCYSWREANWGAWLAALAPDPAYAAHLETRKPLLPHAGIVMDLALTACGAMTAPAGLAEHRALLRTIRDQVEQLPRLTSPMRLTPTSAQEAVLRAEADAVRAAYRQGGRAAAEAALRGTLSSYYRQSHAAWARKNTGQRREM